MKRIALLLAGGGVYGGSEIHEAVLALLAIEAAGPCYMMDASVLDVRNNVQQAVKKQLELT